MFSLECVWEGTATLSLLYVISNTGQECECLTCEGWLTLNVTVALSTTAYRDAQVYYSAPSPVWKRQLTLASSLASWPGECGYWQVDSRIEWHLSCKRGGATYQSLKAFWGDMYRMSVNLKYVHWLFDTFPSTDAVQFTASWLSWLAGYNRSTSHAGWLRS